MENELLYKIQLIRSENNKLWMKILEIAMKKAPEEFRQISLAIVDNDKRISGLMLEISEDLKTKA